MLLLIYDSASLILFLPLKIISSNNFIILSFYRTECNELYLLTYNCGTSFPYTFHDYFSFEIMSLEMHLWELSEAWFKLCSS